jgi:DNA-binding beta-propeller fold protein YncE
MRSTIQKAFLPIFVCAAVALPLAILAFGQDRTWPGRPDSGWLYVVDSKRNAPESAVLVVDPEKGRIVASLSGGYQPNIAVSPDGLRLYVSYSEKENTREGILAVIDTSTGAVLKELPNQNRWLTTHYDYVPNMVLSRDGAWLYLFKMLENRDGPTNYVEIFDTQRNAFLPNKVDVPECISATMIPSVRREGVYVICGDTRDVRFVSVDRGSKTGHATSVITDVSSAFPEEASTIASGHRETHHVATGFVNSDGGTFTVITTDGLFLRADAASGRVSDHGSLGRTTHGASVESRPAVSAGWFDDRWVRNQAPVLSPDGKRLYLGLGTKKRLYHGSQLLERIVVLDTATMELMQNLDPNRTFWSFAISGNENRLYVVDSEHAVIGVLDVNSGRELGIVSGVGTTPVYAVVAP